MTDPTERQPREILVNYRSDRCPQHADGGHRLVDQGYAPELYGHRYVCACGVRGLGNTDESRARAAAVRTLINQGADEATIRSATEAYGASILRRPETR